MAYGNVTYILGGMFDVEVNSNSFFRQCTVGLINQGCYKCPPKVDVLKVIFFLLT